MTARQLLFVGMYFTFFVNGFTSLVLGAVMPYMMEEYAISYTTAGMLLSFLAVSNLVTSYFMYKVVEAFGKKRSIVVLSAFVLLGFTGMVSGKSVFLLALCCVFLGISRGSISNINNSVINDEAPGNPRPMSYLHTFFAVGAFAAPLFTLGVMGLGYSWKMVVWGTCVLCCAMVLVYAFLPIRDMVPAGKKDASPHGWQTINVRDPRFVFGAALLFFCVGAEDAINGWLVTYLKNAGIMSGGQAQGLLCFLWAVMTGSRLACAQFSGRFQGTWLLVVCGSGTLAGFLLFIASTNFFVIAAGVFTIGLFIAPMFPTTIAVCSGLLQGSTRIMGAMLAIMGIGRIITPYVVGAVAQAMGIASGMACIAVALACMIASAVLLRVRSAQPLG